MSRVRSITNLFSCGKGNGTLSWFPPNQWSLFTFMVETNCQSKKVPLSITSGSPSGPSVTLMMSDSLMTVPGATALGRRSARIKSSVKVK